MKILLVDDHVLFREGLSSLLRSQPTIDIVGAAKTVAEAISSARKLNPELILMDYSLPDGTGADAAREILAFNPDIKIVFLTVHDDNETLMQVLKEGVKGYLLKNTPIDKLLSYLRDVECGGATLSPIMANKMLQHFSKSQTKSVRKSIISTDLTTRELQILKELDTGSTNQEIADRLFISERTVKNHVSRILTKLNLRNRYEAANYARKHGISNAAFNVQ
jgi:DNA-binding NarL/FixJ family response regulator